MSRSPTGGLRGRLQRSGPVAAGVALTAFAVLLVSNFSLGDKSIDAPFTLAYAATDAQFPRAMAALLDAPVVEGNAITAYANGDEFFPAMLAAIGRARHSIHLETYIYWSGDVGRKFASELGRRARDGVEVRVLIDWIGTDLDSDRLGEMRDAGVDVRYYRPPRLELLPLMNNRTHRKLLIVDGRIGFTGGAGIADRWAGDADSPAHWRDDFFRIVGPAAAQMQTAFLDNWREATGQVLSGSRYFPPPDAAGDVPAQVFLASPGGRSGGMQLLFLAAIASARESIRLSMAYFVPDEVAVDMLADAARRGVHVQIIIPGPHIDYNFVRRASRARWGPLLEAGVEIHEYQPTMFHCKTLVIDGRWVSIGSSNFDTRSFAVNDEANVNVYDAAFAGRMEDVFASDLRRSRRIRLDEWRARPWTDVLLDHASALFASQY